MNKLLYFLLPAYNEGKVIGSVIEKLIDKGFKHIVVVNDSSTDNTKEIVSNYSDVNLINHVINRGQGAALATGLDYLSTVENCEYICTYDSDGQHRLEDVLLMLDALEKDSRLDIVIGSRFVEYTNTNAPWSRKMTLKLGTFFLRFMYGLKISDAHNGLRVMRKMVACKMIPKLDDFSHASEMTYLIKHHKMKYKEFPTNIIYSDYSLAKGQSSLNSIKIAFKTIVHKFNVLIFE